MARKNLTLSLPFGRKTGTVKPKKKKKKAAAAPRTSSSRVRVSGYCAKPYSRSYPKASKPRPMPEKLRPYRAQLGQVPDVELAALAAVAVSTVRRWRKRLSIPAYRKASPTRSPTSSSPRALKSSAGARFSSPSSPPSSARRMEDRLWWPELVKDRNDYSLRELSEKYGATPGAIVTALKRNGLRRTPRPAPPKAAPKAAPKARPKKAAKKAAEKAARDAARRKKNAEDLERRAPIGSVWLKLPNNNPSRQTYYKVDKHAELGLKAPRVWYRQRVHTFRGADHRINDSYKVATLTQWTNIHRRKCVPEDY